MPGGAVGIPGVGAPRIIIPGAQASGEGSGETSTEVAELIERIEKLEFTSLTELKEAIEKIEKGEFTTFVELKEKYETLIEELEKGEIGSGKYLENYVATEEHPKAEEPATEFLGDRISFTLAHPALIHVYFTCKFESGGAGVVVASLVVDESIVENTDKLIPIKNKLDPAGPGEGHFYTGYLAPGGTEQIFHVAGAAAPNRKVGFGVPLRLEAGEHKVDVQWSLTGPETAHKAIKERRLMVTVMQSA